MKEHSFLLSPKKWEGDGKITLTTGEEELEFSTKWDFASTEKEGEISAFQQVFVRGMEDLMQNQFLIRNRAGKHFEIELENAALGTIHGQGLIKDQIIAWEFRDQEMGFEGFEFYERQDDGTYLMRAEYATADHYRTIIRGTLWEKK